MSGYIMFKRVGRWHGLRLTDVPATANLLRLRRELRNIQMEFLLYSNANPILRLCY
jgi:hypothetical protein